MAGEHQGHHLVADLAVGEALARLAAGAEQEAEDVAAAASGSARRRAISPKTISSSTARERDHLATRASRGRAAAAVEVDAVEAEGALEVLGRRSALAGLVGIEPEQRPHRDPHRQLPHPLVDVDDLAGTAAARSRASASSPIASTAADDLLAVEGGHHDRPRAVMVVVVDRQQAVAEQRDQVAEARLAPVEVLRVGDGDEVVGLGAEHEDHRGGGGAGC